jgi:AhpD family alkylhydroperoxidase
MPLDEKSQFLIGVGASVSAHCEPCLQTCIALASESGAGEDEIAQAAAVGRRILHCAGRAEAPDQAVHDGPPDDWDCGCANDESDSKKEGKHEQQRAT